MTKLNKKYYKVVDGHICFQAIEKSETPFPTNNPEPLLLNLSEYERFVRRFALADAGNYEAINELVILYGKAKCRKWLPKFADYITMCAFKKGQKTITRSHTKKEGR